MIPVLLTLSAILQRWFMPTISTSLIGLSRCAVARRARLHSCWNNPSPVMLIVSGSKDGNFFMYKCFNASMPSACWSLLLAWLRSQLNNSSLHWPSVARHDHNVSTWFMLRLKETTNIVKAHIHKTNYSDYFHITFLIQSRTAAYTWSSWQCITEQVKPGVTVQPAAPQYMDKISILIW